MQLSRFPKAICHVWAAACLLSIVGEPSPARAQVGVSFTNIVDTTNAEFARFAGIESGPKGTSDAFIAINNNGVVAFHAYRSGGGDGIYRALSSAGFDIMATSPDVFAGDLFFPRINDSGTVAYSRTGGSAGSGIYMASSPGVSVPVATRNSPDISGTAPGFHFSNSGVVTFSASRDSGGMGISSATSFASYNTIATTDDPLFSNFRELSANESGMTLFVADRDAGGSGLYTTASPGVFNTITTSDSPVFGSFGTLDINNAGMVVFTTTLDSGHQRLYAATSSSDITDLISADPQGAFLSNFANPGVNNNGTIAFQASAGGGAAIFIRPAGQVNLYPILVTTGSPTLYNSYQSLFGRTVTDLRFVGDGLNDNNQIAFYYALDNGVRGIARADITFSAAAAPESDTFLLLSLGMTILWAKVRILRFRRR